MSFLYPVYLWALAGVSLPILIHLFGKNKGKPIDFSTLRFLKISRSRTGKAQRIHEVLILFLRTFLLALLLLTLAGPVSKTKSFFLEEQFIVFILDDSFSMNTSNHSTSFQNLQDLAVETLSYIKKPSAVSLVYLSGRYEPFSNDYPAIADLLKKSTPSFQTGNFNLSLDYALRTLENVPRQGKKSIFFFTDLQKRVWEDLKEQDVRKSHINFFIFDVGQEDIENLSFKNTYIIQGGNNTAIEVKNWGEQTITAEVTVNLGNRENKKISTFKPGNTEVLIFDIPAGTEKIYGEIDHRDILEIDNRFFLSLSTQGIKKILIVSEDEDSQFYLQEAIKAASEEENLELVYRKPSALEDLFLDEYQIIFIINTGRVPESAVKKIQSFLQKGGSMVNFPGERVTDRNFNNNWYIKETDSFLMPAYIKGKTSEFRNGVGIGYIGSSHPVFLPFGSTVLQYTKNIMFKRLFNLDKISGTILLKTTDNLPLLVEKRIGKGSVLLFTFLPGTLWTNVHTKPFFPVMVNGMLNYLSRKDADVVMVGQRFVVNEVKESDRTYVTGPDRKKEEFKKSFFVDKPGFWNVEIYRGNARIEKTISANLNWEEGNLRKIKTDEIRKKMKGMDPEIIRVEQAREFLNKRSMTSELSYGFLNVILLVFLVEVVVSNLLHYKKLE